MTSKVHVNVNPCHSYSEHVHFNHLTLGPPVSENFSLNSWPGTLEWESPFSKEVKMQGKFLKSLLDVCQKFTAVNHRKDISGGNSITMGLQGRSSWGYSSREVESFNQRNPLLF